MKITNVETLYVSIPLSFSYSGGAAAAEKHTSRGRTGSLIIKLITDEGITGLGDVIVKGGDVAEGEAAKRYVDSVLAPHLVGADPFRIESLLHRLKAANLHHSSVYVAGIDIALHDLVGKALGVPLYNLLGGKVREQVPLTWNVPSNQNVNVMVQQAAQAVENGFTNVIKVKTGAPWDIEAMVRIQEAIGDVPQRPDDNGAFLAGDSIVRFRSAREQGVRYEMLEQPAPNHDLQGLQRVAEALGERVIYHVGYVEPVVAAELLRQRVADAVSVPVFRHGIHEATQMMRAFELVGIGCLMGSGLEGPIAATAAIHVATATRNVCYPIDTLGPLWFSEEILKDSPIFERGYAIAPDMPGLGIELDEKQVNKMRVV